MIIHQLRNATMVVEVGEHRLLVDPMLGPRKNLPPFTLFRYPPKWNPLVELPDHSSRWLSGLTACLITHSQALGLRILQHSDHLDGAGERFLREGSIPVVCPEKDATYLKRLGLSVQWGLVPWQRTRFLGGHVTAIPATHGYGWIRKLMANGAGFFLEFSAEPSLYISGDTVFTPQVESALRELRPDVSVVAAGAARLDLGRELLMNRADILRFVRAAPGRVIANHLEALNHCPTTRVELREWLEGEGLSEKVQIPGDGESLSFC